MPACVDSTAATCGSTALYRSYYEGHLTIVKYLVENGTDVNKAKKGGAHPLTIAKHMHRVEVIKYLVSQGAVGCDMTLALEKKVNMRFDPLHSDETMRTRFFSP